MPLSFVAPSGPRSLPFFALLLLSLTGCAGSGNSGSSGGGGSTPATPTLASITPVSTTAGTASVALTATGTNFTGSSQIIVAGTNIVTTYVSSTNLTGTITASQLSSAGTLPVSVTTGSQTTSSLSFTVNNGVPAVTSLYPTTLTVGGSSAIVTLTGTGFVSTSVVSVNGSVRPTTYVNATTLTATLPSTDLATIATLSLTVSSPAPGGGSSSAASLGIVANNGSLPTILSISPSSVIVGSGLTSIEYIVSLLNISCSPTINGARYTGGASYFNNTIVFYLPSSYFTTLGTLSMSLLCNQDEYTNVLSLPVTNPPVPTLTSLSQSVAINTANTITAFGTGFTSTTVLQLNGVSLTTTYQGSTAVSATIPAGAISLSGVYSITAYTPAPGGGTSNALPLTPYVAIINDSMVYNPINGLFYLSVPSSAGAPYGNSIVSVDPVTGALGKPIFVGSDPDRLALTADGTTLWVGLDGGASVAKVSLATNTVLYTFGLGGNSGVYDSPVVPIALAALPNAPDSVVVAGTSSGSFNNPVQIFDAGVARTSNYSTYIGYATALQVNGTLNEIYAAGSGEYYVFSYSASGLSLKTSMSGSYGGYGNDDLQYAGGRIYTDLGKVYDAESGSLLGSLYTAGTTLATGPTTADTTLTRIFALDSSQSYSTLNQIQIFDLNAYTTSANIIPISGLNNTTTSNAAPSHLTRWGTNGLAFRTGSGFYSLTSNFVSSLASTNADLSAAVKAPVSAATGATSSYTITVSNAGPSTATAVGLTFTQPSTGILGTSTTTQGTCSATSCSLGSIASGASITVTVPVNQLTAGTSTLSATVSAVQNDPVTTNNTSSASVTVTGATYAQAPTLTSLSPDAIQTGLAAGTTVTATGTNFTTASTLMLGGTALSTTYVNPTTLTAVISTTASASLGWSPITVSTPAPGGGTSNALPLSYFQVLTAGLNHILFDPFSRKIMASVGSGSSSLTGNSLVALTPETGTFATPVSVGSQPSYMALASDGSLLYTILTGSESVTRFNMLTQSVDFNYTPPATSTFDGGIALRGVSVLPGSPNTIALDIAAFSGIALFDFNPTTKTAAIRGQATGPYTGSSIHFLDANNLFSFDTDTSGATFNHFTVTSTGFTYYNYSQYTESTLNHFGVFTFNGGLAFANNGGVANPSTTIPSQIGYYPTLNSYSYSNIVAPDTALNSVFFFAGTSVNSSSSAPDGIVTYNEQTFLPVAATPLNMATIEGNTSYSAVDFIRWGQDGLAALTSGGHLYLLRGAAVVPAELTTNSAATLTSLSTSTLAHGAGNTTLTVTGSGFVRGAGVFWNGAYRTSTYLSATQLSVAIPASDLAATGTAAVTVTNPNAAASGALTFTIQ